MTLPPADAKDFFKIILSLDGFFQQHLRLMKDTSPGEVFRLRSAGFSDFKLISTYAGENPDRLSPEDLETVLSWRHGVEGRFLIHQERKEGCLFEYPGDRRVFLVLGLVQAIGEIVPFLPIYAIARLLPFRGRIVSDGILSTTMMHFSDRMAKSLLNDAKEQIASKGLITTLPADAVSSVRDPAVLLKHYLSTAANRNTYSRQIDELCTESSTRYCEYLFHMGKVNAKRLKAGLANKRMTRGWFAILEDTIVAGAVDQAKAAACAAEVVPPELIQGIVWLNMGK